MPKYNLRMVLKSVFGYSKFRGIQKEIIESILSKKDTFVIMPTGSGKSLCYQLPAVVLKGTALIISPLIALMKNQMDQLNTLNINAHVLNSSLNRKQLKAVKKELLEGQVKLLYVAPESLVKDENVELLKQVNLSFLAIDEAHCISEWGHDFRPEYRRIREIMQRIKNLPIIALTATATPKVESDIIKNINMTDYNPFKTSFNRTNLFYEVQPKINPHRTLIKFIKERQGESGIIYCLTRKMVEEMSELLNLNNINSLAYHAGMDNNTRIRNQDSFINESVDVIVATIAFGMGIDKPDVRYIVHYDVPKSLEGYYQETGRSGRDGLNAHCLLLYNSKDLEKLNKFNKDKSASERENAILLLKEVQAYGQSMVCRRKFLLNYFGEYLKDDCNHCDNCVKKRNRFDAQLFLMFVLKTISENGNGYTISQIIEIIQKDSLKESKLKQEDSFWENIIRQAIIEQFLEKDKESVVTIRLTEKGYSYTKNPYSVMFVELQDISYFAQINKDTYDQIDQAGTAADEVLFCVLKKLARNIAKRENLPPYVIFQEVSLKEMATIYPVTEEELGTITGVGVGKTKKFGKEFLSVIKDYVKEYNIDKEDVVVVKSNSNKSKNKVYIIQQIDRKVDLAEVASNRHLDFLELLDEIEQVCKSGTQLNLDYYISQVIDEERQEDIFDYFMNAKTDDIEEAKEELKEDNFSEEEIRLVRIKFLSEVSM